jgi:hypothetical protein
MRYLVVLFMLASASGQCARDLSSIPAQVATNGLKSLNSLHDYVWVMDLHQIMRDRKGKVETRDHREQTIVANGQMYVRPLQPGETPEIPESATALSSDYRVYPAAGGNCGVLPCDTNPYVFFQVNTFSAFWDVLRIREGELNGSQALVLDLHAKHLPRHSYEETGTAWVEPEHCHLMRLITFSVNPKSHEEREEVAEFSEIKGSWLPVKRQIHAFLKGRIAEYTEEYTYTYLKFGASVRIVP